jgi:DNA-directed RNA polymerase sigma subunit (sigma70/sigma32)
VRLDWLLSASRIVEALERENVMTLTRLLHSLAPDQVAKVLKSVLTYREREIVKLRTGLGDGYSYSLDEVAHVLRISAQEVLEIEELAFGKISDSLGVTESAHSDDVGVLNVASSAESVG